MNGVAASRRTRDLTPMISLYDSPIRHASGLAKDAPALTFVLGSASLTTQRSLGLLLVAALTCAVAATVLVWRAVRQPMTVAQNSVIPPPTVAGGAFVKVWSTDKPGPVRALAPAPDGFYALADDHIYRFDADGNPQSRFTAPSRAHRIATDARGAIPFLAVVSSLPRQVGDVILDGDYFLHLYDAGGRERWKQRFDGNEFAGLEPLITTLDGRPVVVLSARKRILCFDIDGALIWNVALWHHPGTLASINTQQGGPGFLLAGLASRRDIVRIDGRGTVMGTWASMIGLWVAREDPSRLATAPSPSGGFAAIALRQVQESGAFVRLALTFFDGAGTVLNESELPLSTRPLGFSPIASMDAGAGAFWVVAVGDGLVHAFSLQGRRLVTQEMGAPFTMCAAVQRGGRTSLLVTAVRRELVAWRPDPTTLNW